MPWLIRKINPEDKYAIISEKEQEKIIQRKLAKASLTFIEENVGGNVNSNEHLQPLKNRLELELKHLSGDLNDMNGHSLGKYKVIYLQILNRQRELLNNMNQREEFDEELIRKYLSLIDMEEYKTASIQ